MTTKRQASKSARSSPSELLKADSVKLRELKRCATAQDALKRSTEAIRLHEEKRRAAVRKAFLAGASAQEIAAAVQVSRAKIYQLIGSARALRP